MATKRQTEANRLNASRSRGPHSAHGKRRSSRNAVRHGLTKPETSRSHFRRLAKLAQRIAGNGAGWDVLELARVAAGAELEILRVQRVKLTLIELVKATGTLVPPKFFISMMHDVRWTKKMFQWATGARQTRPPMPTVTNALPPMPVKEPARSAEACRRVLNELLRLSRYENRAISRRDRAIRKMLKAKKQVEHLTD